MLHLVCPICDQLVRTVDESNLWCPWCRMTEGEEVPLVPLPEAASRLSRRSAAKR
jgi:hypothetical protein